MAEDIKEDKTEVMEAVREQNRPWSDCTDIQADLDPYWLQTPKVGCTRAFASVDVKGRGYISRDEMIMALRILNFNPIDSEVEEMLRENDSKSFTYEQFVEFVTGMRLPSLEEQKTDLREAFALFDRMNTGFILKDEFIEILTQCGEMKIDEKEAMSWVEVLDLHKDGKLRISELEELFVNDEDVQSILNSQSWEMV